MRIRFRTFVFCFFLFISGCKTPLLSEFPPDPKQEVGWIEKVRLTDGGNLLLHAKLDTGADYGSLHATGIEKFRRKNKDWVRFTIEDRRGNKQTLEREITRIAKIKRKLGGPQDRYVVRLVVCLGGTELETEVNLVDRSNFSYPMLVGRSFLQGNVVLDPSKSYTAEPSCVVN